MQAQWQIDDDWRNDHDTVICVNHCCSCPDRTTFTRRNSQCSFLFFLSFFFFKDASGQCAAVTKWLSLRCLVFAQIYNDQNVTLLRATDDVSRWTVRFDSVVWKQRELIVKTGNFRVVDVFKSLPDKVLRPWVRLVLTSYYWSTGSTVGTVSVACVEF